jgi:hypothetical protein
MTDWDERKERNERHAFVSQRLDLAPPVFAVALMFTGMWLIGWLVSAALLARGLHSLPLRYAIACFVAYAGLFCFVRLWSQYAKRQPSLKIAARNNLIGAGLGELCAWLLPFIIIPLLFSGFVWLVGGYALLLEVAFEIAFAGTVVQGLSKRALLGNWASALLRRTWFMALLMMALLCGFAAMMQHAAPETDTIAQAYEAIKAKQPK